jgi:hypothetical protein
MSADVDSLLARLAEAERRLVEHAAAPLPPGLTEPDPGGTERWEAGEVWAHLAEFPGYWLSQIRRIVDGATSEPVPFGRVRTDPGRVGAIQRDRHTDPAALLSRVRATLAETTDYARALSADAWSRRGIHTTRGEMTVRQVMESFLVGHMEEHADQLDSLRRAS